MGLSLAHEEVTRTTQKDKVLTGITYFLLKSWLKKNLQSVLECKNIFELQKS